MLIYQSDCTEIYYFQDEKLIETRWLGFASSREYRKALGAYLDAIKNYEVKRWLGDYRQARVVRLKDQAWVASDWAPTFMPLTAKIEKMAKVKSLDISSKISSDNIRERLPEDSMPFLFKEFDDYQQARAWVLT
jgi:hypothetical protein